MKSPTRRLILASASPRRAELLRGLGVEFEVVPSEVDEVEGGRLAPSEVALTNAARKAMRLAESHADALILGADTVVALGGRLFGKPADNRVAAEMLSALSGKTHEVITGVCLLRRSAGDIELFAETTLVTFRPLTPAAIAGYLAKVPVLDKAGAYAIQERGDELVREIAGSFTNVVGLPVERVREALSVRGWGRPLP
ncbi:MAG: Maf family protein [Planctomycetes bacterium]|nr:Maf family protein [Planctomycetota bacterium]